MSLHRLVFELVCLMCSARAGSSWSATGMASGKARFVRFLLAWNDVCTNDGARAEEQVHANNVCDGHWQIQQ